MRRAAGECRERLGANPDLVIVFDAEHGHSIRQGFPGSLPTIVQAGIADEYPIDDPRYTPNCGSSTF